MEGPLPTEDHSEVILGDVGAEVGSAFGGRAVGPCGSTESCADDTWPFSVPGDASLPGILPVDKGHDLLRMETGHRRISYLFSSFLQTPNAV